MRFNGPLALIAGGALATAALIIMPSTAFASTSSGPGLIAVSQSGSVTGEDGAQAYGSVVGSHDVVGAAPTPDGGGYWIVTRSGHVYAFGDAKYYGDTYTDGLTGLSGSKPLNAPIVGIAADPSGTGYWLVASDGGIFNFGSAPFLGSTYTYGLTGLSGSKPLNAPVTAIVAAPSGEGYWLIAEDGGVFDFGDAPFLGSTYTYGLTGLSGSKPLNAPIVGAIATPSGNGYYMVAADGGVFDFGDAKFSGSTYDLGYTGLSGKNPLPAKVTSLVVNPNGSGYYAVLGDGQVLAIGGAPPVPNVPVAPNGRVIVIPSKLPQQTLPPAPKAQQPVIPQQPQGGGGSGLGGGSGGGGAPNSEPSIGVPTTTFSIQPGQTAQLTATGGDGTYTWSESGLPDWASLSSSGELSLDIANLDNQTPTAPFEATVTSGSQSLTVSVHVAIAVPPLTTTSFTATGSGAPFGVSGQLSVPSQDGSGYTFGESGTWPTGLTLSQDGTLGGTIAASAANLEVSVLYDSYPVGDDSIDITVPQTALSITTPATLSIYPGQSLQLVATGGDPSETWSGTGTGPLSVSSSGVLTVNSSLTASDIGSSTSETVSVTSGSSTATEDLSVTPIAPTLASSSYSTGASPDIQLDVTSGQGAGYTFTESGTWPTGLTLTSTGLIGGSLSTSASGLQVGIQYDGIAVATDSIDLTYVPTTSQTSQNWAGIAAVTSGTSDAISSVSGTFVVPTIASTQNPLCSDATGYDGCMASEWVGIDGIGGQQLIQAGVDVAPGQSSAQPWIEVITPTDAAPETEVSLQKDGTSYPVTAGDQLTVTITKTASQTWQITLNDRTTGASYSVSEPFEASIDTAGESAETAEWIMESPMFGDITASSPGANLCTINPTSDVTSAPCNAYSIMPNFSTGGQFTAVSVTSTGLSTMEAITQSTYSPNGYALGANGDAVTYPTTTPDGAAVPFAFQLVQYQRPT
ncbi:G1 family glutamic endopeptidase [Ferrimicrobium sp.]|uniref:G1 family glutamic endopeptidase n=1 Tax=Ferrimicrobium sp. TaxID=2926050 RepID=UPI002623E91C|nr:G1 family glutamic endopeptidase [Ferrimicrobium sp.]